MSTDSSRRGRQSASPDPVDQVRGWLASLGVDPDPGGARPIDRDLDDHDPVDHDPGHADPADRAPTADQPADGDQPSDEELAERARTIVLRQLTGQARTRSELAKKLSQKDIPAELAQSVLDRFTEVGLIDDTEFARSWVDSRQQRRNLSRTALRQELRRKGVDPEVVADAVGVVQPDAEYEAALDLAQRKARSMSGLAPEVRKRRLAGALARRGFDFSVVHRVLDEIEAVD